MAETALGSVLRMLRERRGLSLRELGQLAGVDHAYIHRLETGAKESPSDDVLAKLARAVRAERREAQIFRYLAEHTDADPGLAKHVMGDQGVSYEVFTAVAGAAFRGAGRPDYPKLIERVRKILNEEDDGG